MPHHKTAAKRLKTNEKARKRNVAVKSLVRKQLKKQRAADGEDAAALLPTTYRQLDKAAKKGVIPKARADRLKSRAARAVQAKPTD